MEKLKCITHGCKSAEFYLLGEERYPAVVNEKGQIISERTYSYKCRMCNQTFKSSIGPDSPKKKLLNE